MIGTAIRRAAPLLHEYADRRVLIMTPLAGLVVAALAIAYTEGTGKSSSDVLFSGQAALPSLVQHAASYTVGALLLLVVCKALAYLMSMAAFRGGPTFPALLIGAAGGIAMSRLPGMTLTAGVAMGVGAMLAVMLTLPLTSVLLPAVLLPSSGLEVTPLVIVAVTVAYVTAARMTPGDSSGPPGPAQPAATPNAAVPGA